MDAVVEADVAPREDIHACLRPDDPDDPPVDGRNVCLSVGVRRVLGRGPRDFAGYARDAAAAGAWDA